MKMLAAYLLSRRYHTLRPMFREAKIGNSLDWIIIERLATAVSEFQVIFFILRKLSRLPNGRLLATANPLRIRESVTQLELLGCHLMH